MGGCIFEFRYLWNPEEGMGSPDSGAIGSRFWEPNSGPLQQEDVPLATEPSFQSCVYFSSAKKLPFSAVFCWAWETAASTPSCLAFWVFSTRTTARQPSQSLSLFRYSPLPSVLVGHSSRWASCREGCEEDPGAVGVAG